MHARCKRIAANGECLPLAGILLAGGVIFTALLAQATAGLPELLQWQRNGGFLLSGLTSHLSHWSWNHCAWDVAVFAFLSFLSLCLIPSRYVLCLVTTALLIPLEIQLNQPQLHFYRGLSGIDTALLGLLVAALWRSTPEKPNTLASRVIAVIAASAFVAKTTYELTNGGTVFVKNTTQLFVPVPSAHLVGFLSGLGAGLLNVRITPRSIKAFTTPCRALEV
jgi:hypothetical protein